MPYRFLYLFSTIIKISWYGPFFALWECVWEWFVHGGMSQWGLLKDKNCESIISRLCSVEPQGRVVSRHLIQPFSSTMVHYTICQYKSHVPHRSMEITVVGVLFVGLTVRLPPVHQCVPHQEAFIFLYPWITFAVWFTRRILGRK